jgi:hypothetical protein
MDRRTRGLFVVLLAAVSLLGVGAAVVLGPGGSHPTATLPGAQSVVGVIVAVDSAGLDKVAGFTLRTGAGETLTFDLRALENGAQFAPGHLVEHQATGQPVRVWYRTQDGVRLAIRLEDAT